jgi:hypothetical protein
MPKRELKTDHAKEQAVEVIAGWVLLSGAFER